jgi:hypothetical protein
VSAGCPLEGDGSLCYLYGSRALALFFPVVVSLSLEGVFPWLLLMLSGRAAPSRA